MGPWDPLPAALPHPTPGAQVHPHLFPRPLWLSPCPIPPLVPGPTHTCSSRPALFMMCASLCSWLRGAGRFTASPPLYPCRPSSPGGHWSTCREWCDKGWLGRPRPQTASTPGPHHPGPNLPNAPKLAHLGAVPSPGKSLCPPHLLHLDLPGNELLGLVGEGLPGRQVREAADLLHVPAPRTRQDTTAPVSRARASLPLVHQPHVSQPKSWVWNRS